ncbi:MAG TPA: ATP-grasp domain-containing protein [Candidatus Methanoperedens sp.]|nr:ATP-grasp domain-containing protein [Candidatus Methanoperedens sp.]
MLDLSRTFDRRPALISSSDQFVTAIARHAEALRDRYILSPGVRLQGLLADKQTQYDLAASNGMPMPVTSRAQTESQVNEFADRALFPCLLKPTHFREWQRFQPTHRLYYRKVAIADTPDHLLQLYRMASEVNPQVILQEIIQGPDSAKRVYLSCYDASSRRIAHAMFKELRCDPLGFGPASVTEPVIDEETDEVCDRFLKAVGYVGICEIEMKRDSRDGQVKLIEANPRLSGGGDAAPYAGVDLPWLHYLDLIGVPVTPVGPRAGDFRHVVLAADGKAIPAYWRAGLLSAGDVVRSYRPPLAFFDLDARDWRNSLRTLRSTAISFTRGFLVRGQS